MMINSELIDYVRKAHEQNLNDSEIKTNLTSVGWAEEHITEALKLASQPDIPLPPTEMSKSPANLVKPAASNHSMWDAFEHILLFISMYVLAIAVGQTIHYFIDKWMPGIDENQAYRNMSWQTTLLRGYIAALIVSYPLFSFFFLRILKRTKENPDIRNLKSRKFLIYATLVIAFIILVWKVIQIVYTFLGGNMTMNFVLHFVVTVAISGIIFMYYLTQIKEDRKIYG